MKRVWLALAALVLTAVCAGARIAGDRDSAVAADNGTALPDREEIKYVALTFDDGPSPRCTPQLLDGLKERGVRATFFVVGCQVVKDPDIVIRMAAEGHQVGNHSYDHKELDKLSCGEAAEGEARKILLSQNFRSRRRICSAITICCASCWERGITGCGRPTACCRRRRWRR